MTDLIKKYGFERLPPMPDHLGGGTGAACEALHCMPDCLFFLDTEQHSEAYEVARGDIVRKNPGAEEGPGVVGHEAAVYFLDDHGRGYGCIFVEGPSLTEVRLRSVLKLAMENCAGLGRDAYGDYIDGMVEHVIRVVLAGEAP